MHHPALQLFGELVAVPSPCGHEQALAALVQEKLRAFGYAPEQDGIGNVWVRLAGQDAGAPLVCLAAHMDEIGFTVTSVEADGSFRVERLGGLLPWKLGEGPVEVLGDEGTVTGVLSMGSGHIEDGAQAIEWEHVRVITGRTPAELAALGVRTGSPGAPARERRGPVLLGAGDDPLVAAWTFDDRMGVVALLRLLETVRREGIVPAHPTLVAFTTREEVGGHGAKVLARREQPEIFVAVDGCPVPPGSGIVADGRPAVWVQDRTGPYDAGLARTFLRLGRAAGIEVQPVVHASAASDASMVLGAGACPRVACFGHVRENSHGFEVARLSAFDNVLRLLVAFMDEKIETNK
jgi:putative aminopeptidase FrvX